MSKFKMPRRMFSERMAREGRLKEFNKEANALKDAEGLTWTQASYRTMQKWGFDPVVERRLYAEYVEHGERTKLQKQVAKERAEINEERKMETWDEVIARLPAAVSHAKEIDWVGSHPAMTRKKRQRDPEKTVVVDDSKDLLTAPNGECPSQRAANLLVTYANNPEKFFNEVMGQMKKADGSGEQSGGVIEDVGIEEIRRMLGE